MNAPEPEYVGSSEPAELTPSEKSPRPFEGKTCFVIMPFGTKTARNTNTSDDDTDLDFYLYDPRGTLVFSDTDSTDLMIYTLESKAKPTACLPYRLEIVNLGSVYNQFEMQLTE